MALAICMWYCIGSHSNELVLNIVIMIMAMKMRQLECNPLLLLRFLQYDNVGLITSHEDEEDMVHE